MCLQWSRALESFIIQKSMKGDFLGNIRRKKTCWGEADPGYFTVFQCIYSPFLKRWGYTGFGLVIISYFRDTFVFVLEFSQELNIP